MEMLNNVVGWQNGIVWGPPILFLILGVGLFLTIGLRFLTIKRIPLGFGLLWKGRIPGDDEGQISPFNALMTSLSATIGTGNIAGVVTAVALGGTRGDFLDVDDSAGRYGHKICRGCLCCPVPGNRRGW